MAGPPSSHRSRGHRQLGGSRLSRRALSIPAVLGTLVALVVLAPVLVPAAALADLVTGPRRRRHLRLLGLVTGALVVEVVGLLLAGALWIATGFGLLLHTRWSERRHFALQSWWVGALMRTARATVGLRVETNLDDDASLDRDHIAGTIVLARHTSIGDALLPAYLFGTLLGVAPRYTLKHDLMWDPCIDVVGHRLPHHFIDRGANDNTVQLDAIRDLAAGVDDHSVAVIFPEGTFFTPVRRDRAVERLRADRPALAARAAGFVHLLPPRPAGSLALLDGAPDADVLIVGHIGFEPFTSLRQIYRNVPFGDPIRIWLRRIPRAQVPTGREDRITWLYDQWGILDAEIADRLARGALPSPP